MMSKEKQNKTSNVVDDVLAQLYSFEKMIAKAKELPNKKQQKSSFVYSQCPAVSSTAESSI